MKAGLLVMMQALLLLQLAHAHPGIGIVQDSRGNIYYTDLKQVLKLDPAGNKTVVVPNVHTHELYLDDQDNLFGEHLWYSERERSWGYYVWKLNLGGQVEKVIPETKGFMKDYSFVRDREGKMYWAERNEKCQTISRISPGQNREIIGDKCFHNIRWMKSTPRGEILLVDFQTVCKINEQGHIETIATNVADPTITVSNAENQNSVMGVWDDPQGNLYVAVYSNRQIKKFSKEGWELEPINISSPWAPSGGLIDANGLLWILESDVANRVRLERIDKNGSRKVF
ncbi:MAG: hypothetical protein JST46_08100 [Bacteroidetes bacterium]|nr:hypothetical protein [Bacteroidota bacterium]